MKNKKLTDHHTNTGNVGAAFSPAVLLCSDRWTPPTRTHRSQPLSASTDLCWTYEQVGLTNELLGKELINKQTGTVQVSIDYKGRGELRSRISVPTKGLSVHFKYSVQLFNFKDTCTQAFDCICVAVPHHTSQHKCRFSSVQLRSRLI